VFSGAAGKDNQAMRLLILFGFLICQGAVAGAQSPPTAQGPPGLEVVKYSWSKERIDWEKDPFGGAVENFQDMRRRVVDQRRLERARAGGVAGQDTKIEREMRSEEVIKARERAAPARYAFLYKVSVKNGSAKTIKEIDWDYVFTDAVTGQELDRREFTGVEKISPGKSKELSFLVSTPPTKTISAHTLNKKERDGLKEEVVIVRVTYEDGTVWQRP
jgi:hypothetical protein